ncbi:MAG: hypothetical protein WC869_09930 [Phycisphaerae bacterium]|jgi:hypothetical protein
MSILKILGVRSAAASFLEVTAFFLVISPLYFAILGTIYALIARESLTAGMFFLPYLGENLSRWSAILPIWMWLIEGAGYLLLVTIYWTPGETSLDESELRGLVIFAVVAAVAGAFWLQTSGHYLTEIAGTFWSIMTGTYKAGA